MIFARLPVKQAVLRQAAPAVASQLIALIYSLADTWFVGLLNDPRETAAVTVVYPAFVMLTAISNLFGVGGAAALARALGSGDEKASSEAPSVSFFFGIVPAAAFVLCFFAFMRPLLMLCGATEQTLPFCEGYARGIILIGGVFTVMSAVLANLIRARGYALAASIGLSLGGALNILLDPFFILPRYMGLGAAGAGCATAAANAVSFVFLLVFALKKDGGALGLDVKKLRAFRTHIGGILKTGFPSAVQYALTVVAIAAQSRFVSGYGTAAVAGLGIVKKLDMLPLYFSIGISTGLLPLLAFNHAAGKMRRMNECFRFGTALSFGFALFCFAAYELFAPALCGLFIADENTVTLAAAFLRRMVTAMPLMAICYPMIIRFQATGRNREALACSVLRKGVLDVPLLFIMDALIPLYGLMWVQPIVDGISLTAALLLSRRGSKA